MGLRLAKTTADCEITELDGMPADSSPRVFAIAGIRAVWKAVGFEPTGELNARLEAALVLKDQPAVGDLATELGRVAGGE